MAYEDFKDLKGITIADKALYDKAFNIAKTRKYYGYQRAFASVFYRFFDKEILVGTVKSEVICYEELAEELSKPSIRIFEKKNVHSSFIDSIWSADFKGFRLIWYVIDIYKKYA